MSEEKIEATRTEENRPPENATLVAARRLLLRLSEMHEREVDGEPYEDMAHAVATAETQIRGLRQRLRKRDAEVEELRVEVRFYQDWMEWWQELARWSVQALEAAGHTDPRIDRAKRLLSEDD